MHLDATRLGDAILDLPEKQSRVAGDRISLPCHAEHDPSLSIAYSWLVNNRSLQAEHLASGHYRIMDDHSLVIDSPAKYDTATYTCVASTKLDEVRRDVSIQIKGT